MKRRGRHCLALVMVLAFLMSVLAGCSSGPPPGKAHGGGPTTIIPIKIATDFPTSGVDGKSGQALENGARMAVEEANASNALPGYTFIFVPQNNVGISGSADPVIGAENTAALIDDAQVAGMIGPFNTTLAQDELPLANSAPLVQISPTSLNACVTHAVGDSGCTGPSDLLSALRPTNKITYFSLAAPNNYQGMVGADYAYKTLGDRTAFVIDDMTLDGSGLADAFVTQYQADGGTILGQDRLAATTDYTQELLKIAQLRPQLIYFAGSAAPGGLAIRKQMLTLPALQQTPLMGGDNLNSNAFLASAGASGGPVYCTVAAADVSQIASAATFIKAYQTSYGSLGAYSASSYASTTILLNAVRAALQAGAKAPANPNDVDAARSFRQAVIDRVAQTSYSGVTGYQSFDANGNTTNKVISLYQLTTNGGSPSWKYVTAQTLP